MTSSEPGPAGTEEPTVPDPVTPALPADYTDAGVPTFDFVRDRIEGRVATAEGQGVLDAETPEGRTVAQQEADRDAAEFLLLDRLFPRSVVSALTRAERSLENLESAGRRAGFSNEALRMLGRARAELEYRPLADIVFDLPVEMERLQRSCSAATDAVSNRYFAGAVAMSWLGGVR